MTKNMSELVIEAQAGSEEAMGHLIETTQNDLLKFLYLMCNNSFLAQDLCQEAYIKAMQKIKTLKDPAKFKSWLRLIARNLYLDYLRSPSRNETEWNESFMGGYESLQDDFIALKDLLAQLDEENRTLLILAEVEGYKYEEIAEILKISEGALKSRLLRARKKIEEILEKDETKHLMKSS